MRLTLPQQDVYFEQLLYPNEPIYNIGAKIEIKGEIDFNVFDKAYIELINQHDAYRSCLIQNDNDVKIELKSSHNSQLGFVDFSNEEYPEVSANNYMQQEFVRLFDLVKSELLHKFTLIKVNDHFHYLFSVYHHIITDGWGTSLMFQRLVKNYNEIVEAGVVQSEYPYSYEDFVIEDEVYEKSESYLKDQEYWLRRFKTIPENLFDKKEEAVDLIRNKRKVLLLKREKYNQLNQLSKKYGASTFHVILATLYLYFGRKHQNDDFAIGLPVLNRGKRSYKNTVGLFMGVSPLRIQLDFEETFEELVTRVKNQLRQDYRHQRFPLGKLIKERNVFKEKERVFNITLSYEKQDYSTNFLNTKTRVIPMTHGAERVALALYIREFDEQEDVKIDFDYNLNYFEESEISYVVDHFDTLISSVLEDSGKKLKELNYLKETERIQLLEEFNTTKISYPEDETVIDLFRNQVKNNPQKEAVKDDELIFTYEMLDKLSDQIATCLKQANIAENQAPIGILLNRSGVMIPLLLGLLKSGHPYIPLDPSFPKERLRHIISNSDMRLIIGENEFQNKGGIEVPFLDYKKLLDEAKEIEKIGAYPVLPIDTAYIIYTSGSTGTPKGVEIGHQSLCNFLLSIKHKPGITSKDLLFSVTTYSFDISILEFFVPLISGATLYVASNNTLFDPDLVIKKISEVKPTIVQATPGFYQMLFNAGWKGGKGLKILCGGDLLSESLTKCLIENCDEVWNMYGPTETTIWSSIKKIEIETEASNIGKPICNTQFYITDEFLNPIPIGAIGSIYIGGKGLAKGYYNNPELTEERFINNPFTDKGLIYKTGDKGRWNKNGEIEFLGRNDNQVKIRGYRIELGDIETKLNDIKSIRNSVVIAKRCDDQEAFLVAFIMLEEDEVSPESIISILQKQLPEYMIPYTIVFVEEFPFTPNQKIDRRLLSQRPIKKDIIKNTYVEPSSYLEKKLAIFWSEILKIDSKIGCTDNFFALGGHSLNAVRLVGLINSELSYVISLKTIFDYPTIQLLANHLEEKEQIQSGVIPVSKNKELYSLTPSQYNIWLASQNENISIAYNMPSAYKIIGNIDHRRLEKAIEQIILKYEILRTNFVELGGEVYQKISSRESLDFELEILKTEKNSVKNTIEYIINSVFNLEKDLLLRVRLLQIDSEEHILLFCTHHTIMDGWSLEVFAKALIENYTNNEVEKKLESDNLKIQFKDYSEYLNACLMTEKFDNEGFWDKYLKDYEYKKSFEVDYFNDKNENRGDKFLFELSQETHIKLIKLVKKTNITMHTILVGALNTLIHKMSDHKDVCIGTVNSGRNLSQLDNQIGMFVKTVALRTKINEREPFIVLLKRIQEGLLELDHYQDVPFDRLTKPVFDIILAYQNPEFSQENSIKLEDTILEPYIISEKFSRLPILFNFSVVNNVLQGAITFNKEMYQSETIELLALKYLKILDIIGSNSSKILENVNISLEIEKRETIDFEFNF